MRNTLRFTSLASAVVLVAGLAACAAPQNSSTPVGQAYPAAYPAGTTAPQAYTEFGRVSNVEAIRTAEKGSGSGVGAVIGGLAGGILGHQVGGGSGKTAATVIGVGAGALAGNSIEKNRNATVRESYRVSITLDNGTARAYDVPSYGDLRVGDRVKIENGQINRVM